MTSTVEFAMPSLGADMDAGTVLEWRVGPGDRVERGDIVAVVETDKADIDIEVWQSGTVAEILIDPGTEVPVGTPLALLDVESSDPTSGPTPAPEPSASEPVMPATPAVAPPDGPVPRGSASVGVAASPLARRLAAERGIPLDAMVGTGPGGAVVARDLDGAIAPRSRPVPLGGPTPGPAGPSAERADQPDDRPERRAPAEDRMRSAIAELMARSKRDIPHYYLATDIDLQATMTWLTETNADRPIEERILPSAVLLKAVAVASARHPRFNGFWIGGRFRPGDGIHLGMAVALRAGGLVAPAIHDADERSIPDMMGALRDLVGRARSGRLRGSEMTDATLTVSNLGDRGVAVVAGVIYPPQVALIGLGRIETRPAVVDGEVVARPQVTVTLAADHRATDGQLGARYLNTIDHLLQKPDQL